MKINVTHLEPVEGSEDLWMILPQHILVCEDWREGDVLAMTANSAGVFMTNRSKREREGAQQRIGEGVGKDDEKRPPV